MRAKITINDSLCIRPPKCTNCLQRCPMYVFQTYPQNEWKTTPVWPNLCIGCGLCIDFCPTGAIEVEFDSSKITESQCRFIKSEKDKKKR